MKTKRNLVMFFISGFVALLLCLPGPVIGGPGPGVPSGYKVVGPNLHATIIIGWRPPAAEGEENGVIEAFIRIYDKLYMVLEGGGGPQFFRENFLTPQCIVDFSDRLPVAIATDFTSKADAEPVVADVKDVSNFEFLCMGEESGEQCTSSSIYPCPTGAVIYCPDLFDAELRYVYVVHCDAVISFMVPITN